MAIDENVKVQAELEFDKKAFKKNLGIAFGDIKKFASKAAGMLKLVSIAALFKTGFEGAVELEQAGIRINTILRNRFGLESGITAEIQRQSEAIAAQSIFKKQEIQAAQETLLLNLETTGAMESATKAAELYTLALSGANASGSDLANTAGKIAEAIRYGNFAQFENLYSGEVGLTQEQIAYMSQFATETERANALLEVMQQNFGATKDEVEGSFAGSMKAAMAQFEDLAITIAQTLVPALTGIFDIVNKIIEAFGGLENILIAFMIFVLGKLLYGFITTTLPGLLGMGIAQAFAQGGPAAALAAVGIAGSIAAAVGAAVAGIITLRNSLSKTVRDRSKDKDTLSKGNALTNQYQPQINIQAEVKTDPLKGTVTKIKSYSRNTRNRY